MTGQAKDFTVQNAKVRIDLLETIFPVLSTLAQLYLIANLAQIQHAKHVKLGTKISMIL